jgi:fermentation-respiration switch protein FrsA (DUF1100 family)
MRGYAWQLATIAGWSSLPWLHHVHHPTLVLVGDDDPVVPLSNARLLASRLPNGRLHVVPDAGHLFLLDSAAEAARIIRAHLRDARPAAQIARRVTRRWLPAARGAIGMFADLFRVLWPKLRERLPGQRR